LEIFTTTHRFASLALVSCFALSCMTRLDDVQATDAPDRPAATLLSAVIEPGAPTSSTGDVLPSPSTPSDDGGSPAPTGSVIVNPCPNGQLDAQGSCLPALHCLPGTFVSEANGTPACAPCPSGTLSTTNDAASCTPWRSCQPGEYVASSGSATEDRACMDCPSGQTSTTENAGECTAPSDCPLGTFKDANGCEACSAGSYCSGKSDQEELCAEGTWDDDGDPSTPCIYVTSCAAGQYVTAEGNTTSDRACSFCTSGSYSALVNAAACSEWAACEPGNYVSVQGTSATDRECEACPASSYSDTPNALTCTAWTSCAAPTHYATVTPTASRDRECEECASGTSSSADNASACQQVSTNLVSNADFESGSAGWFSWGGTVSASTTKAHAGTHSLLVSGSGTGPAVYNLDAFAVAGATYAVSFWLSVGKVSTAQANLTRALSCSGTTTYLWIAEHSAVSSSSWTRLSGNFTIDAGCASPKLLVYAEGTGANVDLYVDDVTVTKSM
jgi:Carbohydrate binding domain/TNFR/NGFR cysteine-rich region